MRDKFTGVDSFHDATTSEMMMIDSKSKWRLDTMTRLEHQYYITGTHKIKAICLESVTQTDPQIAESQTTYTFIDRRNNTSRVNSVVCSIYLEVIAKYIKTLLLYKMSNSHKEFDYV